jgi:chaperonin GroEL
MQPLPAAVEVTFRCYPARQIAINASKADSVIVGKVLQKDPCGQPDRRVWQLGHQGLRPTNVVRAAIKNAVSVAALQTAAEATVAEVPKNNAGSGGKSPPG